jgi:hypothetical protein
MTFEVVLLMFQQMLIKCKFFYLNIQLMNQQLWFASKENWNTNLLICIVMFDLKL